MDQVIEVTLDNQGCIVIPADAEDSLGLTPGMTLVVEKGDKGQMCLRVQKETPTLVDKLGVLVVRAKATGDLRDAVRHERDRRLSDLLQQASQ
jgi:bifunctional DNA-binding transcriptional regulator/antitoxin component of YhaV-PrlF toxin-antitoxin module